MTKTNSTYAPPNHHGRMYPLNAPGMPLPGVDFIRQGIALGDDQPNIEGKKVTEKRLVEYGGWLEYQYKYALYENDFNINIEFKSRQHNVTLIPGHIWGNENFDDLGPRRSKVMVIGKIPGYEEKQKGLNLIGPSGKFLIESLEMIGQHDWRKWYVTNLVKFPHPEPYAGGAIPKVWLNDCLPLLHQELRLVRPDYILCLGADAAKTLLNKTFSISSVVGEIFDLEIPLHRKITDEPKIYSCKVMVAMHPAAVLRAPDQEDVFMSGLRGFNNLITGQQVNSDESDIDHRVIDNADELRQIIKEIKSDVKNRCIAIDTEYHGKIASEPNAYLRTIQFSWQPKKAVCVVLKNAGGSPAFKPNIETAYDLLKDLLYVSENWPVRIIAHFARSDLSRLLHEGIDLRPDCMPPQDDPDMSIPGAKFGWEKLRDESLFDTALAAHAYCETMNYKLELLGNQFLSLFRYDRELQNWKKKYCKANGIKESDLDGYGDCESTVLHSYANYDADLTRRLYDLFNEDGGYLDCDSYGLCCREQFYMSTLAILPLLEMEATGLKLNKERVHELTRIYRDKRAELVSKLREDLHWEDFNPNSASQCKEMLFGEGFSGVINKEDGSINKISPNCARLMYMTPIKTTGKRSKPWQQVIDRNEEYKYSPSVDKETLGILSDECDEARQLRDIKFVGQILSTHLKLPKQNKKNENILDQNGNPIYVKGLLGHVCSDGRIHTSFRQTLETGRLASRNPNIQAFSKRRESDYKRILGDKYKYPLRSVVCAESGYVIVEADLAGAELFITALMTGDKNMLDHCKRGMLNKKDPNYYDIHSRVACMAFRLDCEPTKAGLESIGKEALRVAAKNIAFGSIYCRSAEPISRQCREEGVNVSPEEAQTLQDTFFGMYPCITHFMSECKDRARENRYEINPFGRIRRCRFSPDLKVQGESERQFVNFIQQSTVADIMNKVLWNTYSYKQDFNKEELDYTLLGQIHDAVVSEVKIEHLDRYIDEVLPLCMGSIDVCDSNLEGIPNGNPPFRLGYEYDVMLNWGEKITEKECRKFKIPERYCK